LGLNCQIFKKAVIGEINATQTTSAPAEWQQWQRSI